MSTNEQANNAYHRYRAEHSMIYSPWQKQFFIAGWNAALNQDAPEPVGSTVGEKMCKWCDETKPLIPMVSGNIIPMICSECGTHVEDWDWKILRAEMKKLRSAPGPANRTASANRDLKCISGTGHLWSDEPAPHCLHCNKKL